MTPEANRVHVIRSIENNDGDFNAMAMCKGSLKTIDYIMRREPIYGMVFLLDLKHCSLSYLLSFTPSLTKNLMRCIDVSAKLSVDSFSVLDRLDVKKKKWFPTNRYIIFF